VIYYWHVPRHRIYLLYGYVKSKREDLTPQQVKVLAELMKDLKWIRSTSINWSRAWAR
jgi:hypothetical protein